MVMLARHWFSRTAQLPVPCSHLPPPPHPSVTTGGRFVLIRSLPREGYRTPGWHFLGSAAKRPRRFNASQHNNDNGHLFPFLFL